jgi:hypothetical protein
MERTGCAVVLTRVASASCERGLSLGSAAELLSDGSRLIGYSLIVQDLKFEI